MLIAGEPSGDILAAELIKGLREVPPLAEAPGPPEFFGAGGPAMATAGAELVTDLTRYAIFGVSDLFSHYWTFRRIFRQLFQLAVDREPDAIILVDFSGFNLRFARAIKRWVRSRRGTFYNWNPRLIYYVSPQVWASRERRVRHISESIDLLLSIFPFEKDWYASRAPGLKVEFVGHPIVDRYAGAEIARVSAPPDATGPSDLESARRSSGTPLLLLLPGSRKRELQAHLPVMIEAAQKIRQKQSTRLRMILPNADLVKFALHTIKPVADLEIQTTQLAESLSQARIAIAASGTVTLECAYFGVPTVVLYRTSKLTYEIGRRIVTVRHIAMPNIIAGETIYPEFIQDDVRSDKLATEALDLLNNTSRRKLIASKLAQVVQSLGSPGAARRAAEAIVRVLPPTVDLLPRR